MNLNTIFLTVLLTAALPFFSGTVTAKQLPEGYDKVLPLEGSTNFRDFGGYPAAGGKTVVRGKLFRSGVMSALTRDDMEFLDELEIRTVVDLRSSEELDLYPNYWVKVSQLEYAHHDYSMMEMMKSTSTDSGNDSKLPVYTPAAFYRTMAYNLKPQLRTYFAAALQGKPLVVNCSAGQDRTGVAAALMLSALGVSRDYVVYDYLMSTHYRRPGIERGNVDLQAAAETNAFAR
ncbi:MAG: tyrosine-protein phosphatase, partial [Pseudomonadales bacterium]|nr:tyrosine-protein phosphatase [Pseudomonadales bacterium]